MTEEKTIKIPLNKRKLVKGLIGSIIFVVIGFWLLIYQPETNNPIFDNPLVKYGAAIASILFFGFGIFYFSKKTLDKKPGITIDDKGIFDNSSVVSVGYIPWADFKKISIVKVMEQEYLIIGVNNPEYYLNKQTNFLKKKGMQYNYNNYGSPLAISMNKLTCDIKKLSRIIENKFLEYKNNPEIKDELIGLWKNDLDNGSGFHAIWGWSYTFNEDGTGMHFYWNVSKLENEIPFVWERVSANTIKARFLDDDEWYTIEYTLQIVPAPDTGSLIKLTDNNYKPDELSQVGFWGSFGAIFKPL